MIDVPVKVKDALREGTYRKNYKFNVLNDDGTIYQTIENDNLVKESVSIDERMNSGDKLKFGLCEGSSLEFQYFGLENFTGRRIQAFIEVEYDATGDYVKVNDFEEGVENAVSEGGYYKVYSNTPNAWTKTILRNGTSFMMELTPTSTATETYQDVILTSWDSLEVVWGSIDPATHPVELQKMVEGLQWYTIPMGFFTIEKCSRQASTGIIKVTAYNKLQSDYLDAKANAYVDELIEQGEYGYTDKVSMYTLLKDLLSGYGITKETYNYMEPQLSSYQSSNITALRICDNEGRQTNYYVYLYMIEVGVDLDHEEFYKFKAYTSTLKAHAKEYIWKNYKTYTTLVGSTVYTLEQLADSAYSDSYDLCGEISLRKYVDINTYFFTRKGGRADLSTGDYSECRQLCVSVPVYVTVGTSTPTIIPSVWRNYFESNWGSDYKFFDVYQKELSAAEKIRITKEEAETFGDVTLRELQSAVYETQCQYGQLDRETDLFSGVELNNSRLYPQDTLYPSTSLYPGGAAASAFRSTYSKLWADEGNVRKWKYLIITYKGLDGQGNEVDKTLQKTVNADGTDNYNCSDNWLFRNLVWASEDVDDYAEAMKAKMQNITWFPFEMWAAGLPYLETGDEIEIPLGENTYKSYILQRQLKGIQNLQDTYINGTLDVY